MAEKVVSDVYKDRRFRLLLYPEDSTHVNALAYICEHYDKYIWICHDKDINSETKEPKKAHWHIVIEFKNSRYNTGVAKELKISTNWIYPCDVFDGALDYLLHRRSPEKYQYDIDECFGTLVGKLKDLINKGTKSECEKVIDMLNYIDEQDGYCSFSSFVRHCADVGSFDILRRSGVILMKCVEEHNHFSGRGSSMSSSK